MTEQEFEERARQFLNRLDAVLNADRQLIAERDTVIEILRAQNASLRAVAMAAKAWMEETEMQDSFEGWLAVDEYERPDHSETTLAIVRAVMALEALAPPIDTEHNQELEPEKGK